MTTLAGVAQVLWHSLDLYSMTHMACDGHVINIGEQDRRYALCGVSFV